MKTAKFGGTSLCDAAHFRMVRDIILADPERRFIVVSAPGKRFPEDTKITDHLIACAAAAQKGGDIAAAFAPVRERFEKIIEELGLTLDLSDAFRANLWAMECGAGRAFCLSRGEYFSARIMAALLKRPFIDPIHCVFFDSAGRFCPERAAASLSEQLRGLDSAVMPGFYGGAEDGSLRVFSRGGSDISGVILAQASGSEVYENWTDVPGVLAADPRIVSGPRGVELITYNEVRELAYLGATVLHPDAVLPAKEAGIPIHIRNTMDPTAPGTRVVEKTEIPAGIITGLAGKKGYSSIQVEKGTSNSEVGYVRRILSCLEGCGISFEHLATGVGSTSIVVPTEELTDHREQIAERIHAAVRPDSLQISDGLAMITVVGRDIAGKPLAAATLFSAINALGIPVRLIDQGTKELNIVVGIDEAHFEKAMQAVYAAFFPKDEP